MSFNNKFDGTPVGKISNYYWTSNGIRALTDSHFWRIRRSDASRILRIRYWAYIWSTIQAYIVEFSVNRNSIALNMPHACHAADVINQRLFQCHSHLLPLRFPHGKIKRSYQKPN